MPVPDNFKGKKGRSGRKKFDVEIGAMKEKIKEEALIELANRVVFKTLTGIDESDKPKINEVKDIAMPIALKGMTDKKDLTSLGEKLGVIVLPQKDVDPLEATSETGASLIEE